MMDNTIALFADVMGFAAAIEDLATHGGIGLSEFSFRSGAPPPFIPDDPSPRQLAEYKIWKLYTGFHNALKRLEPENWETFDEMMIFSDSAFIIKHEYGMLDTVAAALMSECFNEGVPIRIGIAKGDFVRRPFSTVHHPGGKLVTEAPFLGSSIVRAYQTQSKGCPGFRILVHPSVEDYGNTEIFLLPEEDRSAFAWGEINWLLHGMRYNELPDLERLLATLASMRAGVSNERALRHYDATEQSIRRMHAIGWDYHQYRQPRLKE
jgi:hypothetical protein